MKEELNHDILKGVLNGVEFNMDNGDDPLLIPAIPCEVCGWPIWLGTITSSCGDSERDVYQEWREADGFQRHECGVAVRPDHPDCLVCFDDDEEEEDEEEIETAGSVIRFLDEPSLWTSVTVAR